MRMIEKLSQSSVVTPPFPVRSNVVFGVVEKPHSKQPASANRAVALRTASAATRGFLAKPEIPELPSLVLSVVAKQRAAKRTAESTKTTEVRQIPFGQWRDLGSLAAAGLMVILASVSWAPRFSSAVQLPDRRSHRTTNRHAANDINPPVVRPAATSPLLAVTTSYPANTEKPKRSAAPPQPGLVLARQESALVVNKVRQSTSASSASRSPFSTAGRVSAIPGLALVAPSAAPGRRFVAHLPPGYFDRPFVSGGNLVGELQPKVFPVADGAAKEESVWIASPKLGEMDMPAIRRWHYSPYQALGSPVMGEMQSKMSFLGPDAAPTASAANRPSSLAK
jgi:hypothetical protein